MEQILAFVTPCQPLTERCKFSIRVVYSWISLGLVLSLILGLFSLGSKTPNPSGLFFYLLFATPTAICIFGFIGLGVSSARGDDNYHSGWYWYFFPIVTYLVMGLWIATATLALVGFSLPKPRFTNSNSTNGSLVVQRSLEMPSKAGFQKKECDKRGTIMASSSYHT